MSGVLSISAMMSKHLSFTICWQTTMSRTQRVNSASITLLNSSDGHYSHLVITLSGLSASEAVENWPDLSQLSQSWWLSTGRKLRWLKSTFCACTRSWEIKDSRPLLSKKSLDESICSTNGKPSTLRELLYQHHLELLSTGIATWTPRSLLT